jgi:hypothetical protein
MRQKTHKAYPIPQNLVETMKQERVAIIELAWPLPGGDFALERLEAGIKRILRTVAGLPQKQAERLSKAME